jgi:hypothetical protein
MTIVPLLIGHGILRRQLAELQLLAKQAKADKKDASSSFSKSGMSLFLLQFMSFAIIIDTHAISPLCLLIIIR